MSEKLKPNLLAILEAAQKIQQYTNHLGDAASLFADTRTFDAVLMNFVVIGESANRLPDYFKEEQAHIDWSGISGFRNIIAHNYFGVDADEVWQIIQEHLPLFVEQIRRLAEAR